MAVAGTRVAAGTVLHMQLDARGIPVVGVSGPPWLVEYGPGATEEQVAQGDAIVAAFDGQDHVYRTLCAIYFDVQGLTGAQYDNVWAAISAPTAAAPRLYLADEGSNAVTLFAMDWQAVDSGADLSQQQAAARRIIAAYVQDYPYYLDHPDFDTTVAVYGLAPVDVPPAWSGR